MRRAVDSRLWIVAPSFFEWDLGRYLEQLLAAQGAAVGRFAYRRADAATLAAGALDAMLLEAAAREGPEIALVLKGAAFDPETFCRLRAQGVFVALWYVDCPSEAIPSAIGGLVPAVDVFFTTAKGMLPRYGALGSTPVHWLVEGAFLPAFPDVEAEPGQRPLYASPLAFVGNLLHPPVPDEALACRRLRLLARLAERFGLKIWGPQGDPETRARWGERCPIVPWPAYHEELVKICRASEVVLGINTVNSIDRYFSNRTYLTLASGGFHLTHYVPGLEHMFTNHEHLVWYRSDDECEELAAHYLARPDERRRIARDGREWVRARYGMERSVERLLDVIDAQRGAAAS